MLLAVRRLVAVGDYGVPVGEHHPNAKLSDADVDRIRELYEGGDHTLRQLSEMFNAPHGTIRNIVRYRRRATTAVDWRPARGK